MKIVNILLSVLILILAIVSAGFSYFLYQKRNVLVNGWGDMSKIISETASVLDQQSGTNVAKDLSPDKLSYKNYQNLQQALPLLSAQAKKIQNQRNELSDTISKIAATLELPDAPGVEDLENLNNYRSSSSDTLTAVSSFKERTDGTASEISRIASSIGADISASKLNSDSYKSELNKLATRIDAVNARIQKFNSSIKQIAATLNIGNLNLDDNNYAGALIQAENSVKKLKLDFETTSTMLRETKGELDQLSRNSKAKAVQLASREKKIKELQRIIANMSGGGKDNVVATKIWEDGSKEALAAVKGQIIDVNRKYGFVVVNLGKDTLVQQNLGKSFHRVNPRIHKDVDMVVARGLESEKSSFIGKIKLVKVNENCSIANVIPNTLNGRRVRIGDTVFFSNKTIAKIGK